MAAKFNWEDPFHLDGQLSADERAVRDAAHAYCQEKLQTRVLMAAHQLRAGAHGRAAGVSPS